MPRKGQFKRIPESVQIAVLEHLTAVTSCGLPELAEVAGISSRWNMLRMLKRMVEAGTIKYDAGKASTWHISGPPRLARKLDE